MRKAEIETIQRKRIGGRMINNLEYADDTTLISGNFNDLKMLKNKVKETSKKAGLRLDIKKTKVMTIVGLQIVGQYS